MNKEAAEWIFRPVGTEFERPDLVLNWFKFGEDACQLALRQGNLLAFQGVNESLMPGDLIQKLDALRVQIKFNYLLAQRALARMQPSWSGTGVEQLSTSAQRHIERMAEAVAEIDELNHFISTIKSDSLGIRVVPPNDAK